MLSLDDQRWANFTGGYKTPYDVSSALRSLERGKNVWEELWDGLHHQGDVGIASYASVPQLVRIGGLLALRDWNLYGLVSTIEIERHRKTNPPIPKWLVSDYKQALQQLLELGLNDLGKTKDRQTIRAIMGAIALAKGDIKLGAFISHTEDSELEEILDEYDAWPERYSQRPLFKKLRDKK